MPHWAFAGAGFHAFHKLTARFWLAGFEGFLFSFACGKWLIGERFTANWVRQQKFTITNKMCFTFERTAFFSHLHMALATPLFHAFFVGAIAGVRECWSWDCEC